MKGAALEVRSLTEADGPVAVQVINAAAEWYAEFLPPDQVEQPEMTLDDWKNEAERMTWYGGFDDGELIGVIGIEYAGDAALIRHAYVHPDHQRQGVAAAMHQHLEPGIRGVDRIIAGTYASNYQARAALEKGGYHESPDSEAVLHRYYDVPEDRLRASVTYEKRVDR